MYPVKFQTQSDVSGGALGESLMDEVEDMDGHILHAKVSISVEMSRHFSLLCIMYFLVEVPSEPLFQTVLGLPNILFPTSCEGYTVYQILTVAADVVSCAILLSGDLCYDVAISVQLRAIPAAGVVTLWGAPVT